MVIYGHSLPVVEIGTRVADLARPVLEERIGSALKGGRSVVLSEDQAWQRGHRAFERFKACKYLLGGVAGLLAMGFVIARGESVLIPAGISLLFLAVGAVGVWDLRRWKGAGLRLSPDGVSDSRWKTGREIPWKEVRRVRESEEGFWLEGPGSEGAGLTRDGENFLVLPFMVRKQVPDGTPWKRS